MTLLLVVAALSVAALGAAAGALLVRRQSWALSATGLAALALVVEALRRDRGDRWWVLVAGPTLVVASEALRVAVDARRRGTRLVIERTTVRPILIGMATVVATVAACAVAVLALPSRPADAAAVPGGTVPSVFVAFGVAAVAVTVVLVAFALARLGRWRQAVRRAGPLLSVVMVALVGAGLLIGAGAEASVSLAGQNRAPEGGGSVQAADVDEEAAEAAQRPVEAVRVRGVDSGLSWWVSLSLAVAALVLLVVFGKREQLFPPEDLQPDRLVRGVPPPIEEPPTRVQMLDRGATLATVDEALVGLRTDADPRVAVRVSYAIVTRGLGRQELSRGEAETEGEYLTRAFAELGAGGAALRRLTALFARARFSDDVIDESMRAEALAALEQIRAEVERRGLR